MRISDWSSDVCSSDLRFLRLLGYLRSAHPQPGEDRSDAEQSRGDRHPIPGKGGEDEGAADEDRRDHRDEARTRHTQALDRSEEHTSELQSLMRISYAVFCLKKKTNEHIHEFNDNK